MKIKSILQFIRFVFCNLFKIKGHGISILVPVHITEPERAKNWQWLKAYWQSSLPGAEIVIGDDSEVDKVPFSKSAAVNNAASRARGNVFVIVDADVYISA